MTDRPREAWGTAAFAGELRRLRQARPPAPIQHGEPRCLSRYALAVQLGVEPSYLLRLENGTRLPSLAVLARIGEALGLDDAQLGSLVRAAVAE